MAETETRKPVETADFLDPVFAAVKYIFAQSTLAIFIVELVVLAFFHRHGSSHLRRFTRFAVENLQSMWILGKPLFACFPSLKLAFKDYNWNISEKFGLAEIDLLKLGYEWQIMLVVFLNVCLCHHVIYGGLWDSDARHLCHPHASSPGAAVPDETKTEKVEKTLKDLEGLATMVQGK
ncbi:hypothetical protein C8J56DRAFT_901789 [Mycena floridula]|nr:hypothetical protein C8J56DRAFT_901789 [Mycena floridula]